MRKINGHNIFLIDGIGALITAALLFFVVRPLYSFFGVVDFIVDLFAGAAVLFAIYSFVGHVLAVRLRRVNFKHSLIFIAVFNILYCVMTAYVVFQLTGITLWGKLYFIGEILVILSLVYLELKIARRGH